ncbi:uncharacterized protein EI90DRAFT_3016516 [Cantharellus anzutake]|uniref:uncharacterized protein n=1 Tax=Cantharellus anzutake TaxID=1750568 RepID=UPI0019051B58|nr:uncharacterized protein EI90DRAFT_3016516 [Cantharellus anzutake]KAF8331069.1 hypothetical protein EI90DRAFT_3016516 [Cantharellus anzutake]
MGSGNPAQPKGPRDPGDERVPVSGQSGGIWRLLMRPASTSTNACNGGGNRLVSGLVVIAHRSTCGVMKTYSTICVQETGVRIGAILKGHGSLTKLQEAGYGYVQLRLKHMRTHNAATTSEDRPAGHKQIMQQHTVSNGHDLGHSKEKSSAKGSVIKLLHTFPRKPNLIFKTNVHM